MGAIIGFLLALLVAVIAAFACFMVLVAIVIVAMSWLAKMTHKVLVAIEAAKQKDCGEDEEDGNCC